MCPECSTSWNLHLREVEVDVVCLVLTRWKDLGPGLSPEDLRWRVQVPWGPFLSLSSTTLLNDPRMRFERHAKDPRGHWSQRLSFEDMLTRNLALLLEQRYQRVMKQWTPMWWSLYGYEEETKNFRPGCVVS